MSLSRRGRYHSLLLALVVLVVGGVSAPSHALELKPGRYSFGLSGGFSNRHVNVGGSFGYVLEYGFQPTLSIGYGYRNEGSFDTHQVRTTLELRWYAPLSGRFTPYLSIEGSHAYMAWDVPTLSEEHNLFLVGGGGGLVVFFNDSIGLQFGVFVGAWVGADDRLYDLGVIDEAPVVTGRFGIIFLL